jgi:hypothetical protein
LAKKGQFASYKEKLEKWDRISLLLGWEVKGHKAEGCGALLKMPSRSTIMLDYNKTSNSGHYEL